MTFLEISNRLAVKHDKHISRLGGATNQNYFRTITALRQNGSLVVLPDTEKSRAAFEPNVN